MRMVNIIETNSSMGFGFVYVLLTQKQRIKLLDEEVCIIEHEGEFYVFHERERGQIFMRRAMITHPASSYYDIVVCSQLL